jgi:hypothetical protein
MKENSKARKIAFVGDHLPRKCGIATLRKTAELCRESGSEAPTRSLFSPDEITAFKEADEQAALDLARKRDE